MSHACSMFFLSLAESCPMYMYAHTCQVMIVWQKVTIFQLLLVRNYSTMSRP